MRRSSYLWLVQGLTLGAFVVPSVGLLTLLPAVQAVALVGAAWLVTVLRFRALRIDRHRPRVVTLLLDEPLFCLWGGGLFAAPLALVACAVAWLLDAALRPAVLTAWLGGLGIAAWAVWGRRRLLKVRELEVPVDDLPTAFDGYRIVQLTDLHVGSFDPLQRGLSWARRANRLSADLVVVTGDLVVSGTAFYDDVAEVIGNLRGKDGVFVSMGNHDQWDNPRLVRALREKGATVLLNQSQEVRRGNGTLVIAGIDDRYAGRADLDATLERVPADKPSILLSHYPDFFEEAAARGVSLVLSGHTHGGQLGLPGLADRVNVATLGGQRGRGLVLHGDSALYVSAGLGTTGPPMRLGISPEIAVLVLRPNQRSEPRAAIIHAS